MANGEFLILTFQRTVSGLLGRPPPFGMAEAGGDNAGAWGDKIVGWDNKINGWGNTAI